MAQNICPHSLARRTGFVIFHVEWHFPHTSYEVFLGSGYSSLVKSSLHLLLSQTCVGCLALHLQLSGEQSLCKEL